MRNGTVCREQHYSYARQGMALPLGRYGARLQNGVYMHCMEPLELYRLVEDRRRELGFSQAEVGRRAVGRGDSAAIQHLRRGKQPSLRKITGLCEALGLELYIGLPRGDLAWGPNATEDRVSTHVQGRLKRLAQEYEHWPLERREAFPERFVDAMAWLLGPWPYEAPEGQAQDTRHRGERRGSPALRAPPQANDRRLSDVLAAIAESFEHLNERGREDLLVRFWSCFPDLKERLQNEPPQGGGRYGI